VARDDRGRVLLVQQRGGPFKGEWLLPGGGVEGTETPEQAAVREVREECGLEVRDLRRVCAYSIRVGGNAYETILFAGEIDGDPAVGHDGEAVRWSDVPPDAHPVLLRELRDGDAIAMPAAEIDERLARAGIRMTRL
jgi:8-oxo-dGTP diphosphatase